MLPLHNKEAALFIVTLESKAVKMLADISPESAIESAKNGINVLFGSHLYYKNVEWSHSAETQCLKQ